MRRIVLVVVIFFVLAAGTYTFLSSRDERMTPQDQAVVILGFDGMAPDLLDSWFDDEDENGNPLFPNLRKLRDTGQYARLGTTNPPESPVAWASFSTGLKPGNHGIFDFLARDLDTNYPTIAGIKKEKPKFLFKTIPYKPPVVESTISGTWFWKTLGEHQIGSVAFQIPMTFPLENSPGSTMMSGLGTPDLRGTQGTFHYFATDLTDEDLGSREMGGRLGRLEGANDVFEVQIEGPVDVVADKFAHKRVSCVFEVNRAGKEVFIHIQDQELNVKEGAWSDWAEVSFALTPIVKVHGIIHFHVLSVDPEVRIYVGPIEFHPRKPPFPITRPKRLAPEMVERFGFYKSRGWAVDTAGLQEELLPEGPMLEDAWQIMDMRNKLSQYLFDEKDWSVFIAVFSATDRVSHMFYRLIDERSPRYDLELAEKYGGAIKESYVRADRIVGEYMAKIAADGRPTTLIVMSDHGFHPFNKGFNLNTWLVRNGFMYLEGQYSRQYILDDLFGEGDFFEKVDWSRTKAYALGLGQIYINLKGRERRGIVEQHEYQSLCDEIAQGLVAYRDDTDYQPILAVYHRDDVYQGQRFEEAPDLQVGFNRDYRVSWQTCLGGVPVEITEDNPKKWSGDHCSVDWRITPGVILTNARNLDLEDAFIYDLAPTVLDMYGVPIPEEYEGKSLLVK
jgi:predicted AlkP superfamily phosphohydrolase/phosphomutase